MMNETMGGDDEDGGGDEDGGDGGNDEDSGGFTNLLYSYIANVRTRKKKPDLNRSRGPGLV